MRPQAWIYTIPLRFRSLFRRGRVERELAEEFEYHLQMQIEEFTEAGMAPREARRAALRALGGMEQCKEQCRDVRGLGWLHELGQDLGYADRILKKSPGFTIVAVLMLALAIGANTAVVGIIDALMFRPFPFAGIDRLVSIEPGSNFVNYLDLRKEKQVF